MRVPDETPPAMTPAEAAAVVELFADELAVGWIPKRADLEAALEAIRAQSTE